MKYIGSPWGKIRGKLNGAVGGVWKGIDWGRVLVFPTQRGTLEKYQAYKAGKIHIFSFPQMNIRIVVKALGFLSRKFYSGLNPIWLDYLARHPGMRLSAMNAFVKTNIASFFASMPSRGLEYIAATNAPLLTALKVSKGDLEPIENIATAIYTTGTGALVVTYGDGIYENGLATDKIWWAVAKKPILDSVGIAGTWEPSLYLYGMAQSNVTRTTKEVTIALPKGLTATDLTVYIFCKDSLSIGYSDSKALAVAAA